MSICVCFWKYRISCNDLVPPLNFIPFLAHLLGLSVALSLSVSGCLLLRHISHSSRVQPLASHGVLSAISTFFPLILLYLFCLTTVFLGVRLVRAILPLWIYLEHKLLATLLNRSTHAGATSHTVAPDWLEAIAPCADLIFSLAGQIV